MKRSHLLLALAAVVLAGAGYWAYRQYLAPLPEAAATPAGAGATPAPAGSPVVSAEAEVLPAREAVLAFRAADRVAEVLVARGATVAAGQLLVRLENAELAAQVQQAEAALAEARAAVAMAQAELDQLLAGPRPEEIAAAEANLKAAQSAVGEAVARRDEVTRAPDPDAVAAAEANLAEAQSIQKDAQITYDDVIDEIEWLAGPTEERTRYQLNAANQALAAAQAALDDVHAGAGPEVVQAYNAAVGVAAFQRDAAAAQLALLKAGATREQIAAARARVQQAQARVAAATASLEAARALLAQTELVAPFAGTVVALDLEPGEMVTPGAPVLTLADLSTWKARTSDLAETDVVLVQPGQPASVTLDAFGDRVFPGVVTEIAALAETNRGNTTYAVTVELAPSDAALRWGMTAFVDIEITGASAP
jgi:multidrug efflux pump subunit AcrA (membrane-fusion protein)